MSTIITKPLPGTTIDPLYPDSDGEPMGESGYHVSASLHLYGVLKLFFRKREDIYVAADMFLYYERGNPKACKAPDVMVVIGVNGNHERRSFKTWEEGVAPTVIFEVTSPKTHDEDEVVKPSVYEKLGVKEYFIFDPDCDGTGSDGTGSEGTGSEGTGPALAGYRLKNGKYHPLQADASGLLTSEELGMSFEPDLPLLRAINVQTGKRLPSLFELFDQNAELHGQNVELHDQNLELHDQNVELHDQNVELHDQNVELHDHNAELHGRNAELAAQYDEAQRVLDAERKRVADLEAELARLREAQGRSPPPM